MIIINIKLNISSGGEVRQGKQDFFGNIDVDISVLIHLCVSFLLDILQWQTWSCGR